MLAVGLGPAGAQQASLPAGTTVPGAEIKPGQILVKLRGDVSALAVDTIRDRYDAEYVRTIDGINVLVWQVAVGREWANIDRLNAEPSVEYAEPIYRVWATDHVPNDPDLPVQWAHIPIMQSPAAWEITTGRTDVTIAVLDSGVDGTHPDLASKLVAGYDFVANDPDPADENGHGTHVAGIAAAVTDNGIGVAGMDWQARIMSIRVLNAQGSGYTDALADGILWAAVRGADVLNMSLGGSGISLTVQDAVSSAYASGSVVVAAMGNDSTSLPFYPAAYNNVLAVAATTSADVRAAYSNYGSYCDVAAPGGFMTYLHDPNGIYSTMPTYPVWMTMYEGFFQGYDHVHGTSQAAPYVSGLASLMLAVNPALTPGQLQSFMESTAVDLGAPGWDVYYGHGRINPGGALGALVAILSPIRNADGDGQYLVDWNDVPNATGYTLQEDEHSSFDSPDVYSGLTSSHYQVTGQDGGVWYYRVRADFGADHGPWSETQTAQARPQAPTLDLYPSPTEDDEYRLVWSEVGGAAGYLLQEGADELFTGAVTRYMGKGLTYLVTGQEGGSWHYRVRAYNVVGNSTWSAVVSATVPPAELEAPLLHPISNPAGDDQYVVDWDVLTGADSYLLEECSDPYFESPTMVYSGSDPQFEVTGQPGGTWRYRVRAYGTAGNSPWSSEQRVVVPVLVYLPLVSRDLAESTRTLR
jgi:subtilisin family serine protease